MSTTTKKAVKKTAKKPEKKGGMKNYYAVAFASEVLGVGSSKAKALKRAQARYEGWPVFAKVMAASPFKPHVFPIPKSAFKLLKKHTKKTSNEL